MAKLRRALVHGGPARFWFVRGDALVLRHPRGHDWTEVPIAHLDSAPDFQCHLDRLSGKHWITNEEIEELVAIRAGRDT